MSYPTMPPPVNYPSHRQPTDPMLRELVAIGRRLTWMMAIAMGMLFLLVCFQVTWLNAFPGVYQRMIPGTSSNNATDFPRSRIGRTGR